MKTESKYVHDVKGTYYQEMNRIIQIAVDYSDRGKVQMEMLGTCFLTHLFRAANKDLPEHVLLEEVDNLLDMMCQDGKRIFRDALEHDKKERGLK